MRFASFHTLIWAWPSANARPPARSWYVAGLSIQRVAVGLGSQQNQPSLMLSGFSSMKTQVLAAPSAEISLCFLNNLYAAFSGPGGLVAGIAIATELPTSGFM